MAGHHSSQQFLDFDLRVPNPATLGLWGQDKNIMHMTVAYVKIKHEIIKKKRQAWSDCKVIEQITAYREMFYSRNTARTLQL